jgi:hypothetical protein
MHAHHHIPNLGIIYDTTGVVEYRFRIDTSSHGSTGIDFGLDFVHHSSKSSRKIRVGSVFCNGSVGEAVNGATVSRSVAGATRIEGTASSVNVGAKASFAVRAAGNVRLTGIVGDSWNGPAEEVRKQVQRQLKLCKKHRPQTIQSKA